MRSSAPLVAAFVAAAAFGCAPHEPASTSAVAVHRVAVPSSPPPADDAPTLAAVRTFDDELVQLDPRDPESIERAVLLWVQYHAVADAATRLAGLVRLQQAFGEIEGVYAAQLEIDPVMNRAVMQWIDEDDGGDPADPAALQRIADLGRYGIGFRRVDGGLVHVEDGLIEHHAGASLLPEESRWLRAIAFDDEHTTRMGGDDPRDLVRSMLQWEQVIDDGEPWASWGRSRASHSLEMYLELCFAAQLDEPVSCPITPEMRRSYALFIETHRDSRLHRAVESFTADVEALRFAVSLDQLDDIVADALARVAVERPGRR